jgi:hypothetical protein
MKANWIAAASCRLLAMWPGTVPCPAPPTLGLPELAPVQLGHECRRWTPFAPARRQMADFERPELGST